MSVRIPDSILSGKRVLSTECTLCLTCLSACPTEALSASLGFDLGGQERLVEQVKTCAAELDQAAGPGRHPGMSSIPLENQTN